MKTRWRVCLCAWLCLLRCVTMAMKGPKERAQTEMTMLPKANRRRGLKLLQLREPSAHNQNTSSPTGRLLNCSLRLACGCECMYDLCCPEWSSSSSTGTLRRLEPHTGRCASGWAEWRTAAPPAGAETIQHTKKIRLTQIKYNFMMNWSANYFQPSFYQTCFTGKKSIFSLNQKNTKHVLFVNLEALVFISHLQVLGHRQ